MMCMKKTQHYKNIVKYLNEGKVSIPEAIKLQNIEISDLVYSVNFIFHFSYDWSNGVVVSNQPTITSIKKSNKQECSKNEIDEIIHYIRYNFL